MSVYEVKPVPSVDELPSKESGSDVTRHDARSPTGVKRIFNFTQMFFFALSYMASWESIIPNVGLAFYNGGPRALVWGCFIVFPGVLCQVASFAELSSIQPIAGAQYHWTWHLAPAKYRRSITWFQGWITWFAWISLLAGVVNIAANVTTTLATTSYPGYVAQGWHTILIMWAYLLVLGLLNMYAFWIIPYIEIFAGFVHIALWIAMAAVLLAMAPRHDADFVFLQKANLSGWESDFVSFNLGIVLITWGFVGFDASAHISEETRKASSTIPRTMFWGIVSNMLLSFGMILIFMTCLGDVDAVLAAGYPLIAICLSATKSVAGASALVGGNLMTIVSSTIGSITSASRLTWAWSRDGALPAYFSRVDPKQHVPVRSVWLPMVIVALISLLNLASVTAFSVILSLSTFGLYQSYFVAIACMLSARLSGRVERAPWSLGRAGVAVNVFALVYTAWLGIFMVFPNYLPIDANYMNYALPINAFIWLIALVTWFAWARNHWPGLDIELIDKIVADGARDTKD